MRGSNGTALTYMDCLLQWPHFLARSESNEKGHALAMGRGVCTSQDFRKALQYSTPHVFQEDGLKVLVRGILLVRLPKTGHTSKCNIQCVTAT